MSICRQKTTKEQEDERNANLFGDFGHVDADMFRDFRDVHVDLTGDSNFDKFMDVNIVDEGTKGIMVRSLMLKCRTLHMFLVVMNLKINWGMMKMWLRKSVVMMWKMKSLEKLTSSKVKKMTTSLRDLL
ncbi:hypothetical protein GBA52_003055 [Prunus armeniaca]|nr:hypothetical protein GBA52_003055 [Prunus armeniaca]